MKNFLIAIIVIFALSYFGCNNDSGSGGTDPFSGGGIGGGTGNVTIQVQGQADGQGNYIFYINPNVAITVANVTPSVAAAGYQETIDVNAQFTAGTFQGLLQYTATDVQQGQQWKFVFTGTTTNGNQAFNATTNYTIP
jgi:hypothetical protein